MWARIAAATPTIFDSLDDRPITLEPPLVVGSERLTCGRVAVVSPRRLSSEERDHIFESTLDYTTRAFNESAASLSADSRNEHFVHTFDGDHLVLFVAMRNSSDTTSSRVIGHALVKDVVLSRRGTHHFVVGIVVDPLAQRRGVSGALLRCTVTALKPVSLSCRTQNSAVVKS